MKRITALLCAVLLVCTVCSCSDEIITGKNETVEPVDNVETLCAAVGVDMPLPSTAKNITCSIVNDFIGQIEFTFNSIIYVFRASKVNSGELLHGIDKIESTGTIEIGDRAEIETFTVKEGGRVAIWYIEGTSYSVTSVKTVSDDALTELCDLLIK